MVNSYEEYVNSEWTLFTRNPDHQRESLRAAAGIDVHRVLDIGCGGGQEMIPFAAAGATCIGVDIEHASSVLGRRLFGKHYPDFHVDFATSAAEYLPFAAAAFDVLICRVAIPYTDNRRALSEMARVLRPGGVLLLKTHHLRYYIRKMMDGLKRRSPLFSIHAMRVILSGTLYHLTGRQPSGGLLLRESFQTKWLLTKELRDVGLFLEAELADSNPLTPSYRISRQAG
jgi:SAM-dependent methyltransferase